MSTEMNCETCESQLLDLLYEELDEPAAKAARSHLEGCASCAGAFTKLGFARKAASQLPRQDAPSSLDEVVMRAARARARDFAAAHPRAAAAAEAEGEGGLWRSIVRFLGGFAMGPQVAMATVFVLVVAIGLWSLPGLRTEDTPDEGGTVVEPDPGGEVAPSAQLVPAEPIQLELDPRVGRVRGEGEQNAPVQRGQAVAETGLADRMAAEEEAATVESGGRVLAEGLAPATTDDRAVGNDRNRAAVPPQDPAAGDVERSVGGGERFALEGQARALEQQPMRREPPPEAPAFGSALRERELAESDRDDEMAPSTSPSPSPMQGQQRTVTAVDQYRQQAQRQPVPQTAPPPPPSQPAPRRVPPAMDAPGSGDTGGRGGGAGPGITGSGTTGGQAGTATAPTTARALYDRGMTRYRSRNWEGAIEDFSSASRRPEGRDLIPSALHHIARSHRQAGRMRAAATQYESLLARHPAYVGAGAAMIELAETQRAMGNLGAARTWLARAAERYPSVAVDARRRLAVVDAQIRAGESVRATTRTEAADEAAGVEAEAASPKSF